MKLPNSVGVLPNNFIVFNRDSLEEHPYVLEATIFMKHVNHYPTGG